MEIRALRPTDDRSRFRSGEPDLDRFFQKFAGQNQFRHYVGASYVAVDGGAILGYVTVAPGEIEISDLPAVVSKKLPRYPLPILRLARLAVDESAQGQGLGRWLLRFVFELALQVSDDYGCVGIVVDAKPEARAFYTRFGFEDLELIAGGSSVRPEPVSMFLALRNVRLASQRKKR